MKAKIAFRATVTYSTVVDMSDDEWRRWNERLEQNPRGREYREITDDLFDKYFQVAEPADWGDPELDAFDEARPAVSAGERTP
jgi:hypothetical protein